MNPREFCIKNEFDSTIILTFNINLDFFEQNVLYDLTCASSINTLVLADGVTFYNYLQQKELKSKQLGNDYYLCRIFPKGCFHCKMIIRFGEKGGKIWIGSGNLSFGGWGGNDELASIWEFDISMGGEFKSILNQIQQYINEDLALKITNKKMNYEWLTVYEIDKKKSPVIITPPNQSLVTLLMDRWGTKKFTKVTIFTGSTDNKGAFLDWCYHHFGIKEFIVIVNRENCKFDPKKFLKKNYSLTISQYQNKKLHGKCYIFEGPTGSSMISGSANCSAAAWLLSPEKGGNVESIVIYDEIKLDDVSDILAKVPSEQVDIQSFKPVKIGDMEEKETEKVVSNQYYIKSLNLISSSDLIEAIFSLDYPHVEEAWLDINTDTRIPFKYNKSEKKWIVELDLESSFVKSNLLNIKIKDEHGVIHSDCRWLDQPEKLLYSDNRRRARSAIDTFSQVSYTCEFNSTIKLISDMSDIFINRSRDFPEISVRKKTTQSTDEKGVERAVNPDELIRSLYDIQSKRSSITETSLYYSPMSQIISLLFKQDKIEEETELSDDEDKPKTNKKEKPRIKKASQEEKDAFNKKVVGHINKYLKNMGNVSFANKCGSVQLIESSIWVSVLLLKIHQNDEFFHDHIKTWILELFKTLFYNEYEPNKPKGLLDFVQERFEDRDLSNIYGEGSLYFSLFLLLKLDVWKDNFNVILRAILLKTLINKQILYSKINPSIIHYYIQNLDIEDLEEWISKAIQMNGVINEFEDYLHKNYESLINNNIQKSFKSGDIIYYKAPGFVIVEKPSDLQNEKNKATSYLFNKGKSLKITLDLYCIINEKFAKKNKTILDYISRLQAL